MSIVLTYEGENDEESLTYGDVDFDAMISDQKPSDGSREYAVYWLECHVPDFEYRDPQERYAVRSDLFSFLDVSQAPGWLSSALRADTLHYVGYTANLSARLHSHINGNGSDFCRLFPPYSLRDVWWHDLAKEALLAEQSRATSISQKVDNGYVFQF